MLVLVSHNCGRAAPLPRLAIPLHADDAVNDRGKLSCQSLFTRVTMFPMDRHRKLVRILSEIDGLLAELEDVAADPCDDDLDGRWTC